MFAMIAIFKNLSVFHRGVNVVPFLEFIGLPESVLNILKNSQSGNALTAYAMYKVSRSTPVFKITTKNQIGGYS